jgi:UDPglucose 6-dehydrogenase
MSQVPAGFTRRVAQRIKQARPELEFTLYYWMETLVFGDAVNRFLHPERLIIGCPDPEAPLDGRFEMALRRLECPIFRMRFESAELTKTAVNCYLAAAVTYANTLADLCEGVGADWAEMEAALRLDARIGTKAYIKPGLGIAGGNLERDLTTLQELSYQAGVDRSFLDALVGHNQRRYHWLLRQLQGRLLGHVESPVIAMWGLTYKKDTHSTKNSIAMRLLVDLGGAAEFHAWDPAVGVEGRDGTDQYSVLDGADALLIMNDWDVFAAADVAEIARRLRGRLVIDCPGVLRERAAELGGLDYVVMGRSAEDAAGAGDAPVRGRAAVQC